MLKDVKRMVIFSKCFDCKNCIEKTENDIFVCRAFPDGIPEDVFWNRIDHTENIEGDNGIKYEEIK